MNYNMPDVITYDDRKRKKLYSADYNVEFDKVTGFTQRWGRTLNDNPVLSKFGPEIIDIELVVDGCNGIGITKDENGKVISSGICKFCYKGNTNKPARYMTLKTFKKLMTKLPRINDVLFAQQVAFGLTGIQSNPDFIAIMEHTRKLGVIPNFTLSGFDLTDEIAEQCAGLVGAIAVSAIQENKELCYRTVRKFLDLGVKQTNIHLLYHDNNESFIYEVMDDIMHNPLLRGLNAVVLLNLKPKNRGNKFIPATDTVFTDIVDYAIKNKIPLGFDSCSATKFNRWLSKTDLITDKESVMESVEPCESFGLFSAYISVDSNYYPCSFAEGADGWKDGMNVLASSDFLSDIWFSERMSMWRQKSLDANRQCILYPEIN